MIRNPPLQAGFAPVDHGLVAWSYDPISAANAAIMAAAGTLNVVRLKIAGPTLVTAIDMLSHTAGGSLTAGQCFAMLFDETGARVGITADQASAWASGTGLKDMALTAPVTVNGPFVYVGLYGNGTTLPTWRLSVASATPGNANLSAAVSRFGYANTGLTSTPPTTLGTITAAGLPWWVGLR